MRMRIFGGLLATAAMLAGCTAPGAAPVKPTIAVTPATTLPAGWPEHQDGDKLWKLVDGRCVPAQLAGRTPPSPCDQVTMTNGRASGYVMLKDQTGLGQYLLMPTQLITGIEDTKLRAPGAVDYFNAAWNARSWAVNKIEKDLGIKLTRDDMSIAVNSFGGRSQDLLHLHVDCLDIGVRDSLHAQLASIGRTWSTQPLKLKGHDYFAIRIDGDANVATDPFDALKTGLNVPSGEMGLWTLVLAGATFSDGPGFVLLASRAAPPGWNASGEELQNWDHLCSGRSKAN